jgi:hypothetical protein
MPVDAYDKGSNTVVINYLHDGRAFISFRYISLSCFLNAIFFAKDRMLIIGMSGDSDEGDLCSGWLSSITTDDSTFY